MPNLHDQLQAGLADRPVALKVLDPALAGGGSSNVTVVAVRTQR